MCLQRVYVPIEFIIMSEDYNVEESAVYIWLQPAAVEPIYYNNIIYELKRSLHTNILVSLI